MRVKRGNVLRKRHKKILKLAKGFQGARSRIFKVANTAVMKALKYKYRDRRNLKRNMRRLWIVRINAATRQYGMSYSKFMNALKKSNVAVNRKMLADMAVNQPEAFSVIVETAKANNLKPFDYVQHLLEEIPKHMNDKDCSFLEDLLPWSEKLPAGIRKA